MPFRFSSMTRSIISSGSEFVSPLNLEWTCRSILDFLFFMRKVPDYSCLRSGCYLAFAVRFVLWHLKHSVFGGCCGFCGYSLPGPWHSMHRDIAVMPMCFSSEGILGDFLPEMANMNARTINTKMIKPIVFFIYVF